VDVAISSAIVILVSNSANAENRLKFFSRLHGRVPVLLIREFRFVRSAAIKPVNQLSPN